MSRLQEARRLHFRALKLVEEQFLGAYRSRFKGSGVEFDEARPFVNGDEIRTIDWKLTAKMGTPYIKLFKEERELQVLLLIDISSSLQFGSKPDLSKQEIGNELAILLALSAVKNSDKIGLILFSDSIRRFIPPRKGIRHVDRILSELLLEEKKKSRSTHLKEALLFLNKVMPKRAIVFIISDFLAQSFEKELKLVSMRHEVLALHLIDPEEKTLKPRGIIKTIDLETEKEVLIDTCSKLSVQYFFEEAQKKRSAIKKSIEKAGALYIEMNTQEDIYKPLEQALKK